MYLNNKPDSALQLAEQSVALDPSKDRSRILGQVYTKLDRYSQAEKTYLAGLDKDPHEGMLLFGLCQLYKQKKDFHATEKRFALTTEVADTESEKTASLRALNRVRNEIKPHSKLWEVHMGRLTHFFCSLCRRPARNSLMTRSMSLTVLIP